MSWSDLVATKPPSASRVQPKEPRKWFEIHNSANADEAEVMIFDEIGGWWGVTAEDFAAELKEITAPNIKLRLSSPGGSVFEGICIGSALRHHPANVTVYVDSLAASIASVIMLAGDRIVAMPGSQIMIHAASTMCYGNADDMEDTAKLLRKNTENIASLYRDKAGGTTEEWLDRMESETWYTAEEALAAGLVDEIYMPPKKEEQQADHALAASLTPRVWDLSMYRYAGREQAPAPAAAKAPPGQRVTAAFLNGIDVTEHILDAAVVPEPPRPVLDASALLTDATFLSTLCEMVRQSLADAAPPFLPKKGEGDEEEDDDEEEDEDEESQPDDSLAAAPPGDGAPDGVPPDPVAHAPETTTQADDWNSVVGLLHAPTSPSADDVFAQLKEGW